MRQDMIDRLREYYSLPEEVSDSKIESELGDSLGHSTINLGIAISEVKCSIKIVIVRLLRRLK